MFDKIYDVCVNVAFGASIIMVLYSVDAALYSFSKPLRGVEVASPHLLNQCLV